MSLIATKANFNHSLQRFEESDDEFQYVKAKKNQITVLADVHHQPFLDESDEDYHTGRSSDDIELVELKPNGVLKSPSLAFRSNSGGHVHLEASLSSYSSSNNYSDYEHVYEESQCEVVDFKNPSFQVFAPDEQSDDTSSVNINEALNSLDQVLYYDEDNLSMYSDTMSYSDTTSSLLSHSMISLSLSFESETSSSQLSEATYRLGSALSSELGSERTKRTKGERKKREFIRRVERFGFDLQDTCLFPLALPMDGSDIYKGASTWESINLLADCVLSIWTDRSKSLATNGFQVSSPQSLHRWSNPVLPNSFKYLCLQPELSDRFLLHPDSRLPFRRSVSETDLSQLGIDDMPLSTNSKRNLVAQISYGGDSTHKSFRNDREERDDDEDDSDRNRSRSTLTTYLAKRVTSFKEAKQRKDRFNLNLTKNMKTEAKRLASKNELENPYKFARKISKLEKRYYLSVASREFMSLVFKKGSSVFTDLEDMLEFGQELSQLIADLVCTEFTVDDQGQLIANAIETAFTLHQKGNLQSFKSIMRGLQLPEVYRLKNAWKVVQQKHPLHLRVFLYLTFLMAYKLDHSVANSASPCLPCLSSFVDILRIRCLSIWDQLEGKPHWKKGPAGLVSLLTQYQIDEDLIEKKVTQKLANDLERKLKKWQQKGRQGKFPLKRLIHPESKTMANILRKEQKHAKIGRDTISRLKASSLAVEGDQMPITWSLRSLRHLPSQFQMPVIREFNSVFGQLIVTIEAYKF